LIDSLISGVAPRKYTITYGGWGARLAERSLISHWQAHGWWMK
jgi:hypothetical protein